MLTITVPITQEGWDEAKQEFVEPTSVTLQLEHSFKMGVEVEKTILL